MKTIAEPSRQVEVVSEVDVAVVGSGCAGLAAALAAARNGMKVALIERLGFLGGCVTATHMDVFWMFRAGKVKAVEGIGMEVLRRIQGMGGVQGDITARCYVDVEMYKLLADRMVNEAGIELWLHSLGVQPVMDGNAMAGVVTESKSGRKAILAKAVVDVTGDADLIHRGGGPTEYGREGDGLVEPMSLSFRLSGVDIPMMMDYIRKNPEDRYFNSLVAKAKAAGDWNVLRRAVIHHKIYYDTGELAGINSTRVILKNPTNVRDITDAEVECREQVFQVAAFMRKYVPGCEKSQVAAIATQIAARESRRIVGGYTLTIGDVRKGATFPDAIAKFPCFIDLHQPDGDDVYLIHPRQPGTDAAVSDVLQAHTADYADAAIYDIPYRALVPSGIENVLTAGRSISADHMTVASIRYLPASFATGQAAGTAAALAIKNKRSVREVDVEELQKKLVEQGAYLGE